MGPTYLSQKHFVLNKQYFNIVNITFVIDKIICRLLWQHSSTLIRHLQANLMGCVRLVFPAVFYNIIRLRSH
jgi:uncharacterized protein with PQ loop repeat